jgi:hypothetical protein
MLGGIAAYLRRHHVALLALFVALGGTAVAAGNVLPRNSVGTPQLQNGAVTKAKIAKRTLTSLRGLRGPRGEKGVPGPSGPGATSFSTTVAQDSGTVHVLTTTSGGIAVKAVCTASRVELQLATASGANGLEHNSIVNKNGTLTTPSAAGTGTATFVASASNIVDLASIARNSAVGNAFWRFDLHAAHLSPCRFWGMITPSTAG